MSELDPVVHTMLNRVKNGELVYHQQGPNVEACKAFARKLGLPEALGDASLGMVSCRLVHQGVDGCVNHTAKRWKCGFERAFRVRRIFGYRLLKCSFQKLMIRADGQTPF